MLRNLYKNKQGSLHVGILSSNSSIFSHVFLRFQPNHPDITIRPYIDTSDKIYNAVVRGDLDFGYITSYSDDFSKFYPNVECTVVNSYELMLCMFKNNPVFSKLHLEKGTIPLEDMPLFNELTFTVANTIPMIKDKIELNILPSVGLKPKSIVAADNTSFLLTSLYLENLFSILPFSYVSNSELVQMMLPTHPLVYKLLIHQKNRSFSKTEKEFIKIAGEEFKQNPYYYYL